MVHQIEEYLYHIYAEFKNYFEAAEGLCDLGNLTYENSAPAPDYAKLQVQQLYLLRYAYGYSFEYTDIFRQILQDISANEISIVSVGCGSMIDYWSLIRGLHCSGQAYKKVKYVGIDKVAWNYRFTERENDEMRAYLEQDAVEYFMKNQEFASDIYFFPKSISEFSVEEIKKIAACFQKKPIRKDKFYVCISLRDSMRSRDEDMQKSKILEAAIVKNGFSSGAISSQYFCCPDNREISEYDRGYRYPKEIRNCICSLDRQCKKNVVNGGTCRCRYQSKIDRNPILRTGHLCYQIMSFERIAA